MSERWQRPEARWLGFGALLGAVAGAVAAVPFGLVVYLLMGEPRAVLLVVGTVGLPSGALVGVLVGAVVSVLVGRDCPRPAARRRATWAGLVVTPLMVVVVLVLLPLIPVGSWSVPLLVMAAPIGAAACRWVAGRTPDRPDAVRR